MKLKTVEVSGATYAVVTDGKPVFVNDDGSEVAFDAPGTVATISRLNGEAKSHREAKEGALAALKAFEGLDAAKARDALDKLGSIDAKKLIDAGEVDKVKAEAIKAVEEQYKPIVAERDALKNELYGEKIGGAFARSSFAKDKLAIPADFVQARFGSQFKLEEGKVVAYDASGNKIYSKARPGEVADFDEALEFLVNAYPQRDHILKGSGAQGSGARPSNGGSGGAKTMTRAEFDGLPAVERTARMRDGFTLTD